MAAKQERPADSGMKWVWRCKVCGFIEDGYADGLPESYACPICGNGPKKFERVQVPIGTPRGLQ